MDVRSIMEIGWVTEERTISKGVPKIRPVHSTICISFNHINQCQCWDYDYPGKSKPESRSVEEMIGEVRFRLLEAMRIRLQANMPVGTHLSGGIDSAVIAGMAKQLLDTNEDRRDSSRTDHKLQYLGVAFHRDSGFDESGTHISIPTHGER